MTQLRRSSSARLVQALLVLGALHLSGCGSPEEKAQNHYERAKTFLTKDDYVKARLELRNALQRKPDFLPAWRSLVLIEERDQNWQAVAQMWRKVLELDPKDIEARLRLTRLALLSGALDEALKLMNAALDLNGEHAGAIALRAAVLFRLNDSAGATREAQRALEIEPGNPDANVVLAAEKFSRNDLDGALRTLDAVAAAQRNDIGIVTFRLKIFEKKGDLQQVEAQLRRLIELQPREPVFKAQLIRFYVANQRQDDAEKELRAIAAANPADSNPALDVVRFLQLVKGADAARQELTARINAGGRVFPYQMALVELDISQGKHAESVQQLESLIRGSRAAEDGMAARLKLAELHASRRNYPAAETLIAEIIRADNRSIGALKLRAVTRMEQGQLDDAIIDLRQALNDQPRSDELMSLLAIAYERKGSIELADKQYFDAAKASNFAPNMGLNYVSFLRRRGNITRAEEILIELASRRPNDLAVLSALAEVRLIRQNWVGAHEVAEAVRRLGDQRGLADQIQAAALAGQKKYTESLGVLENAYAANPGAIQPMFALVRAYIQVRQADKAEAFLQSVIKANPANAQAWVLLGSTQLAANAPDRALQSFNSAIRQQPKDPIGYRALADYQLAQKNVDEALRIVRAGLQEQPESFSLRLQLAGILELKQDTDGAIREYESLLKEQPGSMVVANNLASLLSDYRTDKASYDRAYTIALTLTKTQVPQFKDTLGWIHYLRGDHRAAASLLEEAVAELPNLAFVRYHLAMTYIARGESDKAVAQLQKALELTEGRGELAEKLRAQLKSLPQRG